MARKDPEEYSAGNEEDAEWPECADDGRILALPRTECRECFGIQNRPGGLALKPRYRRKVVNSWLRSGGHLKGESYRYRSFGALVS